MQDGCDALLYCIKTHLDLPEAYRSILMSVFYHVEFVCYCIKKKDVKIFITRYKQRGSCGIKQGPFFIFL